MSNETEKKKSKKNKNTEPMPAYKTCDSSYLIEGTKSEKTTILKLTKSIVKLKKKSPKKFKRNNINYKNEGKLWKKNKFHKIIKK